MIFKKFGINDLRYVNFEDELENLESVQKSSSKTYDLRDDDSNEELSDIVSLQSITLTNESSRPFSSMIEESKILSSSSSSKSIKQSDNLNELKSVYQNCQETIEVNKNFQNEKINLIKVTVENLSESSEDEFEKFKRPINRKDSIPM